MRPSLRQLDYLIALKNKGSFSDAAAHMFVTQSTLSAGIKELEEILGQKVASRHKRHVTLTPFGDDVARKAAEILNDVDHIVHDAQAMGQPMSGVIRLGVIPTIAPYILPRVLPVLRDRFPNLELQVFEDISERVTDMAQNGLVDAILLALPYKTQKLKQYPLWDEPFYFASSQAPKTKKMTLKQLDGEDLLLLEEGHCLRDHALSACGLPDPSTHKTFSTTSLPTLIQMVASGYGATLLPDMVVKTHLSDAIHTTPFKNPPPTRTIGMAWHLKHPKVDDFKILADVIQSCQP